MSKSLNWLTERLKKINEVTDEKKLKLVDELFRSVLNECSLYIVALKETTDEELQNNRARAYIDTLDNFEKKSYFRLFTDEQIAKQFARKNGAVKNDRELVINVSKEEFILQVRDAFMMVGLDGILIEDGKYFVTISSEQFLKIGIVDILNLNEGYDISFINTVRCIFDIYNKRYRLVAPIKTQDIHGKQAFIDNKAVEYTLNNELLIFEYYEKYKVEKFFKEPVYYLDLDIELFKIIVDRACNSNLDKINIVYSGKTISVVPKNIQGLLETIIK